MRHWLGIALLLLQGACVSASTSALELTPAPREMAVGEKPAVFGYEWRIEGEDAFPEAAAWLEEEFQLRGWKISDGAASAVKLTGVEGNGNPEYYTLSITDGAVELGAATREGMFRAAGRFLALLKQPFTEYDQKSFTIPAVAIADWPDFPVRLMTLTMFYWEPFDNAERMDSSKKIIEAMAEHGFNFVSIGIGSNYKSEYFKSNFPTPWSREELKELVRFSKSRGVVPFPYTQFVSHVAIGPQVALLKGPDGKAIGHDIEGEEFYKIMPKVLDELLEIFDNPPYFRLGGDEANNFFKALKKTPEENARLFTKAFNFLAGHLASRNCRAIIWHDMLFAPELGGRRDQLGGTSEAEVIPSELAMELLSKDSIVDYWNYLAAEDYPGLDDLRDAGFEVWASTWYFTDGIFRLANYAGAGGATGYDGTTWNSNHTKGGELVLVGEVAWNSQTEAVNFDPDEVFMREWRTVPRFDNAESASPLKFDHAVYLTDAPTGEVNVGNLKLEAKPFAAARTEFLALDVPDDIVALKAERPDTELFVTGSGERFVINISLINTARPFSSVVLYTPTHGKSTGTNIWGEDWTIVNGQITKHTSRVADTAIPAGGAVLSANSTGAELHMDCRKITKDGAVEFIVSRAAEAGPLPLLTARCGESASSVVLVFASELNMYADKPTPAATVTVKTAGGREEKFNVNADFALYPDPNLFGNYKLYYLPGGLLAVVWNSQTDKPAEVNIQFTPIGTAIGAAVVGAAEVK